MNRCYGYLWGALLIMCMAMMSASCSSDADMYENVSADDVVIARGNLTTVIENTGSEIKSDGVALSPSLQKLSVYLVSGRDRQRLDNLLAVEGVDLSDAVVSVNQHMEASVTMKVTDGKKLRKYLQKVTYDDMQESEEKGYTVYRLDSGHTVFVNGNTACMLVADRHVDASDLEARKEAAKSAPLQSWQKKALAQGSTFNMLMNLSEYTKLVETNYGYGFSLGALKVGYDEEQLEHAFAKINFSLDGIRLDGTLAIVDEDDQPLQSKYAGLSVDASLLKYASADDIFVTMTAVPGSVNWSQIINQLIVEMGGYRQYGLDRATVENICNVLSDIDGTVMLAAGPKNVLKINSAAGWDAVLAAQMKPGMAEKYVQQIKGLVDATNANFANLAGQYLALGYRGYKPKLIACEESDGGLDISVPNFGDVHLRVIENTLIASLAPIAERGDCAFTADEFAGMSGGTILRVPRQNAFSSILQLPFGIDLTYFSDSKTAHLMFKETDTEGRMLENIIKFIAGQSR